MATGVSRRIVGPVIFCLIIMLGGLAVTCVFGYWLMMGEQSMSYTPTTAKVTRIHMSRNTSKSGRVTSLSPEITYSYTVDGKSYSSDVVSWNFERVRPEDEGAFIMKYAQYKSITVYVDPNNPENAVIFPGTSPRPAFAGLGGSLALALGATYLVNAILGFFGRPAEAKDIWGVLIFGYDSFTHVRGPINNVYSAQRTGYVIGSVVFTGGLMALVALVSGAERWWLLVIASLCMLIPGIALMIASAKARNSGRFDLIFDAESRTITTPENAKPAAARAQMIEAVNVREFTMKAVEAKGKYGTSTNIYSADYTAQVHAALDGGIRVLQVAGVKGIAPCQEILAELNAALIATTDGVTRPSSIV